MIDVLKMENVKAGVKNQFHIIPASEWLQICTIQKGKDSVDDMYLENKYTRLIRQQKGIFINDHFIPLLEHTKGIMFLYGGYGSSKTTFAITKQLIKCIENDYHRCYYGRQKKTEARNLFSNIITEIKRNGWEHLFKFSDNPTGTTQIKCVLNNNKFEMFGCDDTDSLKGIDNPTDILVDEINQLTWESFGMLLTRLRGQGYETQFMGLFNNCDVFPDHWLSKYIFNENYGDEKNQKVIEALQKSHVVKHHSNYKHNLFQNADAYYYKLVNQAAGDQSKIDAYANGEWGVKINGMPYYKMFNKELHVRDCYYNPKLPIHFSFDENVNPYFPCLIAQIDGNDVYFIDEIAAVNPYNTLSWVCHEICHRYKNHEAGIYIYGDATSKKDDVKIEKGKNFFTLAADYLKSLHPTIRMSDSNPNNKIRQDFINAILGINYERIFINVSPKCKHLIEDLMNVTENPDGKKGGKDKTKSMVNGIRGVQKWGHFGDCLDYLMCEAFMYAYLLFQSGGGFHDITGGPRTVSNGISDFVEEKTEEKTEIEEYEERITYRRVSRNGYM